MEIDKLNQYRLHLLNVLKTDVLAETLAAMMVEDNIVSCEEDVFLVPSNTKTRTYENDVTYLKKLKDEAYEDRYIEIGTSRPSILMGLPESFYVEQDRAEKAPKDELEKQKNRAAFQAILQSAQTFFKPVELAYNQTHISRELNEVRLNKNNSNLLYQFWGEQQIGSEEEKKFLKTMHLLPYIIGNKYRTEQLINYILQKKSIIKVEIDPLNNLPDSTYPKLGMPKPQAMQLGVNTWLNHCTFTYQKLAIVHIHDISNEEFHLYYKRSQMHGIILDKIERYYFPLDVQVQYEFYINYDTSFFELGEVYEKGYGILGYSTRI